MADPNMSAMPTFLDKQDGGSSGSPQGTPPTGGARITIRRDLFLQPLQYRGDGKKGKGLTMHLSKLLLSGLGILALSVVSGPVHAQSTGDTDSTRVTTTTRVETTHKDDYDPYYDDNRVGVAFGPVGGYQRAQDADNGRLMGGVALRAKFAPILGAEVSVNYRQEKFANDALTVRSWPVLLSGLIYPIPVIYGILGGGWYNTTFDYNDALEAVGHADNTKNKFGWHVGAGLEIPVAPKVTLAGDIKWVSLKYDLADVIDGSDVNSDFYMISGELLFGF